MPVERLRWEQPENGLGSFRLLKRDLQAFTKTLEPEESADLIRWLRETKNEAAQEEIRELLILGNMPLVIWMVSQTPIGARRVEFADLVQEGVFGLMRAIDLFDLERGTTFSTYAYHWIRQALTRAMANTGRTIRFPVHICELESKVRRTRRKLRALLKRTPEHAEVAEELGMTEEEFRLVRVKLSTRATGVEDLAGRISVDIGHGKISIGTGEKHKEDREDRLSLVVDRHTRPEEHLWEGISGAMFRPLTYLVQEGGVLDPREQQVICLRFGIDCDKHTLEAVGQLFNVTRERIRQIESKALRKLTKAAHRLKRANWVGLSPRKRRAVAVPAHVVSRSGDPEADEQTYQVEDQEAWVEFLEGVADTREEI